MKGTAYIEAGNGVDIKYNNQALAEAEKMLGRPFMAVARGMETGDIGIGDTAIILLAGIRGAGNRRTGMKESFAIMDEVGAINVATTCITAALEVLTHDNDEADTDPN